MQMISSPNYILDVLIVGGGSLGIEMAYQMLKKKMKLYKKLKIGLICPGGGAFLHAGGYIPNPNGFNSVSEKEFQKGAIIHQNRSTVIGEFYSGCYYDATLNRIDISGENQLKKIGKKSEGHLLLDTTKYIHNFYSTFQNSLLKIEGKVTHWTIDIDHKIVHYLNKKEEGTVRTKLIIFCSGAGSLSIKQIESYFLINQRLLKNQNIYGGRFKPTEKLKNLYNFLPYNVYCINIGASKEESNQIQLYFYSSNEDGYIFFNWEKSIIEKKCLIISRELLDIDVSHKKNVILTSESGGVAEILSEGIYFFGGINHFGISITPQIVEIFFEKIWDKVIQNKI